jgi:hypothetical protein
VATLRSPALARSRLLGLSSLVVGAALVAAVAWPEAAVPPAPAAPLPQRLSETGLYADVVSREVAAGVLPFAPQYPLWTDGAKKRRWIHLPPGSAVDASAPDAWVFPVGTKVWKEFSFERAVETRLIERTSEGWRFATYRWAPDGSDARLAPEEGVRGAHEVAPGIPYDLPSRQDCLACHTNAETPILGFSALQLSPLRDPLAPHADVPDEGSVDLQDLVERGLVRGLPPSIDPATLAIPAATPRERAVRGWLHANCSMCHNPSGLLAGLDMDLRSPAGEPGPGALEDLLGRASRFRPHDLAGDEAVRVAPGAPERSVLLRRIASRDPSVQMPPLGSRLVDEEARALLEAWIREDLRPVPPQDPRTASLPREE